MGIDFLYSHFVNLGWEKILFFFLPFDIKKYYNIFVKGRKIMKKVIPVFFSIDDNYAPYAKIAIESLMTKASKNYDYHIYILNVAMKEATKMDINSLVVGRENFSINFVDMKQKLDSLNTTFSTRDYYTVTTYYRLFIADMFPQYNKVLYLDSDICVMDDISKLYNTPLFSNLIGAVNDETVPLTGPFYEYVENYLGINRYKYINAGVLLINMKAMREFKFEEKFLNLHARIKFPVAQDQDYINVLCKNKITYLNKRWNKMPVPGKYMPVEQVGLVHYNLSYKPWKYDGIMYEEYFWAYAKKLNLKRKIEVIKSLFDEKKKQKDMEGGAKLLALCTELARCNQTVEELAKGFDSFDTILATNNVCVESTEN